MDHLSGYARRPFAFVLRYLRRRMASHLVILTAVVAAVACSVGTQYGVKSLAVFGSMARGDDHEGSDVDILVTFEGKATFDNFMGLKLDLEELFGVVIEAEDVETVGGLLAHALGRVPIAGSTATVAGLTLTAESLAGRRNRIGTVTVERAEHSRARKAPGRPDAEHGPADQPESL